MLKFSSPSDPTSQDFPYVFTEDGHLCHHATSQPYKFAFNLHDLHGTAKEHMTLVGYLNRHVHNILEKNFNLVKMDLNVRGKDNQCSPGYVYASPGALEHLGTLLVLIQDRGTAGSGLWSWKAVVRQGLETGSQIPYVRWALAESYAILLMNPNEGELLPKEHVCLVWDHLLSKSLANRIVVVAHGYGGLAFVDLLCRRLAEIQARSLAVAFIDSSHSMWHQPLGSAGRDWLKLHSRSWILSSRPTNRQVGSLKAECRVMSAGTRCHDSAPAVCMEAVFRFFVKFNKPKAAPTPFGIVTRSKSRSGGCGGARDGNNNAF